MWNLFGQPACPIEPDMRQWVDGRFRWLQEQLGQETPRKVRVICPTPEFFPDPFDGTPDDAQAMLIRIAGYMNVDPGRFKLFIYSDGQAPLTGPGHRSSHGSAGLYQQYGDIDSNGVLRARIGIEQKHLADPLTLVATLAHEIGHEILIGQGRVTADDQDHEPLTDLVTVFLGMGIFGSNATIRDKAWSSGGWGGWQTSKLGYLDQRTFGYALARFAWTRGESSPPWITSVRPDVRAPLKQALRFLASEAKAPGY